MRPPRAAERAVHGVAAEHESGSALAVDPAPFADPRIVDIVWRARAIATPPAGETAGAPAHGDHVMNPHLPPAATDPRRAAVLLLVCADAAGAPAIVLTERAAHLSAHAGQIALPGGKIEPGESAAEAALREAREEVALPPPSVRVLGETPAYLTRTGFLVVPVVALLTRRAMLSPDPAEVTCVFTAPFSHVMSPVNHHEVAVARDGTRRLYFEVFVGERRVWGVTAGILRLVHEKLYGP